MIISPQYIAVIPLIFASCSTKDHANNYKPYVPYTTTNMMDKYEHKFYENFWNSMIKENCDSNSMVE